MFKLITRHHNSENGYRSWEIGRPDGYLKKVVGLPCVCFELNTPLRSWEFGFTLRLSGYFRLAIGPVAVWAAV